MKDPVITVHVTPEGVRISKVTPHGEEVIEPDAEARAVAVLLWAKIARQAPEGHAQVWPTLEAAVVECRNIHALLERRLIQLEKLVNRIGDLVEQAMPLMTRQKEKQTLRGQ